MIKVDKAAAAVSRDFPLSAALKVEAQKFVDLIPKAKNILISSTLTSDGDSIGGQLGIYYLILGICSQSGIQPPKMTIVNESLVPDRYQFLTGTDLILTTEQYQALGRKIDFDLGIVCDGGIERTGNVQSLFAGISDTVLVDHHAIGSQQSYSSRLLDLESSSTCELIYHLYEFANVPVTKQIAELIYVGIVFDTGFFKHSLTKPRTHYVASHLIATGIDFSKISDRAILERTWEAQLLLRTLLMNMQRSTDKRIISSHWSVEELKTIHSKDGDQEGMINQLYYTDGADVVALFTEREDQTVKISFRAKGVVNVAEFARSIDPQGGGHVRAAGCSVNGSLSQVKNDVLKKLADFIKN